MDISKITGTMRKTLPLKYCGAVIVAAGTASRMGGIDKVMAPINGEPMIVRTVRTFQNAVAVKEIVIVTREDLILPITNLCKGFDKVQAVVVGGSSRQESVGLGLNALSDCVKLAAVHDGARPLVMGEVIKNVADARIVITHGGPASFIMPLQIGKTPIVVPRQHQFNEHVNDHQVEFARNVAQRMGTIIPVEDIETLGDIITNYDQIVAGMGHGMSSNNAKFNEELEKLVDNLFGGEN